MPAVSERRPAARVGSGRCGLGFDRADRQDHRTDPHVDLRIAPASPSSPRHRQGSRRGPAAVRIEHVKLLGAAHPVRGTAAPRKLMLLLLGVRTRGRWFDSNLVHHPLFPNRLVLLSAENSRVFRSLGPRLGEHCGLWRASRGLFRLLRVPSLAGATCFLMGERRPVRKLRAIRSFCGVGPDEVRRRPFQGQYPGSSIAETIPAQARRCSWC